MRQKDEAQAPCSGEATQSAPLMCNLGGGTRVKTQSRSRTSKAKPVHHVRHELQRRRQRVGCMCVDAMNCVRATFCCPKDSSFTLVVDLSSSSNASVSCNLHEGDVVARDKHRKTSFSCANLEAAAGGQWVLDGLTMSWVLMMLHSL